MYQQQLRALCVVWLVWAGWHWGLEERLISCVAYIYLLVLVLGMFGNVLCGVVEVSSSGVGKYLVVLVGESAESEAKRDTGRMA